MWKARFKGRISDDRDDSLGQRRFPEAIFSGNLRARLRSTPKISFHLPGTLGTVSTLSWRRPDPPSWWNGSASGILLHCCYFPPALYLQYFGQLMQNLDVLLSIPAASTERPVEYHFPGCPSPLMMANSLDFVWVLFHLHHLRDHQIFSLLLGGFGPKLGCGPPSKTHPACLRHTCNLLVLQ